MNLIKEICKKASQKLNGLTKFGQYMGISKRRTLMNTFFKSRFNYCPLLQMCWNRSLNNKKDQFHKICVRIVYDDKTSNFSKLLEKEGSVFIHYQKIQQLATEMLKVSKGLCPEIMKKLFQFRNEKPYNLGQMPKYHIPPARLIFNSTESIKFLDPKIWELILYEMKELGNLS